MGGAQGRSGRDSAVFLPCKAVRHSGHVRHVQRIFAPYLQRHNSLWLTYQVHGLGELVKG